MSVTTAKSMSRAAFAKATGLDLTARAGGYDALYQQIGEHRWYLGERGRIVDLPTAAADWSAAVYAPAVAAIAASDLATRVAKATPADLYLLLCAHKWSLSERAGHDIGLAAALTDLAATLPLPAKRAARNRQVA